MFRFKLGDGDEWTETEGNSQNGVGFAFQLCEFLLLETALTEDQSESDELPSFGPAGPPPR
jgi:hypothetical protein